MRHKIVILKILNGVYFMLCKEAMPDVVHQIQYEALFQSNKAFEGCLFFIGLDDVLDSDATFGKGLHFLFGVVFLRALQSFILP